METMKTLNQEIIHYAIQGIKDRIEYDVYGCDLHHELFNTDYFIIGRYEAKQWLENNGGVFEAIETIKEYEQDNFGSVSTDFSEPEHVVNMFAYIEGERVLQESETLSSNWDTYLTKREMKAIIKELESLLD